MLAMQNHKPLSKHVYDFEYEFLHFMQMFRLNAKLSLSNLKIQKKIFHLFQNK